MLFEKLKSARKAKESQSFVKAGTSGAPEAHVEQITDPTVASVDTDDIVTIIPKDESAPHDGYHTDTRKMVSISSPVNSTAASDGERTRLVSFHGQHALLPSTVEVRESTREGRGIYTTTAFSAGSVIMSITSHISVLSTPNLDQYCSACAGPSPEAGLKRCPRCKTVWYCNSVCQNRDWVWHKRECGALQMWAASAPSSEVAIPGEPVRCLGRVLWGSQKEGLNSAWASEIRMMHSNRTSLRQSAFESHTLLAHSVVRYLGVTSPQELEPYGLMSAGDLVDLISRFTTNTFTLTTPALTPIGICVSPSVALANHSCDPNAVVVFPRPDSALPNQEPLLNLVALRDIASEEEVRISYVDTTLPKGLRQKELKEVYSFVCQCTLCTKAQPSDPREALWCPKSCGGICPYPTEDHDVSGCVKCNTSIGNAGAVLDALRVGQEALDKATALQFKDPTKAKQLTTNIIPILTSAGLTPSSHPLLAMTRLHKELLIAILLSPSLTQESLDQAIRTAAKYSAGVQGLLPKGHPVRAVALGELGKLLAVDEPAPQNMQDTTATEQFPPSGPARLKLAYESLVKAHEEVLVGFGRQNGGGALGKEIRDSIVRLEKELGVWMTGIRNVLEDTAPGRVGSPSK